MAVIIRKQIFCHALWPGEVGGGGIFRGTTFSTTNQILMVTIGSIKCDITGSAAKFNLCFSTMYLQ